MELAVGGIYEGKVTGITNYGAFVNFEGGKSGLVHISEVASTFVSDISKHVSVGQKIKVKVVSIGEDGKINLSIKRVENAEAPQPSSPVRAARQEQAQQLSPTVMHKKYSMAPVQTDNDDSAGLNFEDRLKKFMQESDSRIADSRRYTDRRQRSRRK